MDSFSNIIQYSFNILHTSITASLDGNDAPLSSLSASQLLALFFVFLGGGTFT